MLNDFKAFIARGNLLELAIGFIMGAAFSSVVKTFTEGIIMPIVGLASGVSIFPANATTLPTKPLPAAPKRLKRVLP